MSAPVYGLLKRPDELHVVEQAHAHARFVEDSVRLALRETLETYPLDDGDFLFSRQVNFETIHDHEVLAERFGTVGELRAELDQAPHLPIWGAPIPAEVVEVDLVVLDPTDRERQLDLERAEL